MVGLRAAVFVREEAVVGLRAAVFVREEAAVARPRTVDVLFLGAVLFLAGMEPSLSTKTHHDDDRILYPTTGTSYRAVPGTIIRAVRAAPAFIGHQNPSCLVRALAVVTGSSQA